MTRRGRPRKLGPRELSGQLQRKTRRDGGTPEIKSLREWYAGDGDPVLTTYPLGILLANSAIGEDQHRAGCQYAWLHWRVFGRPSIGAVSYEFADRTMDGGGDREAENAKLKAIYGELKRQPGRWRMVLDNIAVYERVPRWMRPLVPRLSDVREGRILCDTLSHLVRRCARELVEG